MIILYGEFRWSAPVSGHPSTVIDLPRRKLLLAQPGCPGAIPQKQGLCSPLPTLAIQFTPAAVLEPASVLLLGMCMVGPLYAAIRRSMPDVAVIRPAG